MCVICCIDSSYAENTHLSATNAVAKVAVGILVIHLSLHIPLQYIIHTDISNAYRSFSIHISAMTQDLHHIQFNQNM